MKRTLRIASALTLSAALSLAVWPSAYPGGRDVPDTQDSSANETDYRSAPVICSVDTATQVSIGPVPMEIRTNRDGRTVLQPTVFARIGRLFTWLFSSAEADGSCPR